MTEPIKWRDARKVKPKAFRQVMLLSLDGGNMRKTWPGWLGHYGYTWADGLPTDNVTHWAPMPKGPKR